MSQLIASPLGGTAFNGVLTDNKTIFGDGKGTPLYAQTNPTGKGLVTGGAIWSGTGFVFDVSDLNYYIDNTNYTSTATQVTLAPSDPSNDRFDIIVVDDAGVVSVVTGTPGNPPAQPSLAWNEVGVTIVLVSAGSTTPTINYDLVYNEDLGSPTEWVASTYSLSGAAGTINNASTVNPFNGTKCITATSVNLRQGSLLTRATEVNIQNFSSIQFAFRLDSAITASQNFNIRFRNSSGTFIGNTVSVFNWGASRTVIGTNQVVVIPITAFGNITNVRSIVGIMAGGTNTPTYNWAWDFIKLADSIPFQSNLGPIFQSVSGTLYSSGAGTGATSVTDSIFFGNLSGFKAVNADNSVFLGGYSGYGAIGASNAVFIGNYAGYGAGSSSGSVFIGNNAGYGATNTAASIAIGYNVTPLSFSGSIVLGGNATNTADNQFMIGSGTAPINQVVINGTGAIQVPVGTTAERIATQGAIRYNTTTNKFEGYDGSTWVNLN